MSDWNADNLPFYEGEEKPRRYGKGIEEHSPARVAKICAILSTENPLNQPSY